MNHSLFDSTTAEMNKIIKDILDQLSGNVGGFCLFLNINMQFLYVARLSWGDPVQLTGRSNPVAN